MTAPNLQTLTREEHHAMTTEQEWLGNAEQPARPQLRAGHLIDGPRIPGRPATRAISDAEAIRDMRRALQPFRRPNIEPKQGWEFPRAGVRRRADGRYQLRIWLDPMMTPDPVQGGACETLAEAHNLGAMICHFARQAAA